MAISHESLPCSALSRVLCPLFPSVKGGRQALEDGDGVRGQLQDGVVALRRRPDIEDDLPAFQLPQLRFMQVTAKVQKRSDEFEGVQKAALPTVRSLRRLIG